ncbi:hypothetical protein E6W17_32075 [Streptomyces sp. A1547]|nr:hypothetical protein E6W17_32075 [Streptomyces sp. A1547]
MSLFSWISRSVGAPAASYAYARARLRSGRSAISPILGALSRCRIPRSSIRHRIRCLSRYSVISLSAPQAAANSLTVLALGTVSPDAARLSVAAETAGRGAQVSGSDVKTGEAAAQLEAVGSRVRIGHDAANIAGASVVVWSSVIDAANPEIVAARAAGVAVAHRSHVLAQLVAEADRSVVVSGTHGKSTATAMLAAALVHLNPSWAAGAAPVSSVNGRAGSGLLIAEGDESDRSVALYRPDVAVVLNADDDHPETFSGMADVVGTLTDFAVRARTLVACADDAGAREVVGRVLGHGGTRVVTFGERADATVRMLSATPTGAGGSTVTVLDPRGVQVRPSPRTTPWAVPATPGPTSSSPPPGGQSGWRSTPCPGCPTAGTWPLWPLPPVSATTSSSA